MEVELTYEQKAAIAAEWMAEEQKIQIDKWREAKARNDWGAALQHICNAEGLISSIKHAKAIALGDYSGREPITPNKREAILHEITNKEF